LVVRYRTPTERNTIPMMKHSIALLVATVTIALSGCQLYFGEEENNGSWTYCGSDGYYECNDNDCYWRGPDCPAGGWGSGSGMTPPGGFECDSNTDCAAGCYCANGICEEAGFCTKDSDCGTGYTCDEARSSCVPDGEEPPTACVDDNSCPSGEYCDNGYCTASCSCITDAEAKNGGFDYCDEERQTCLLGSDPDGDCAGPVTCNLGRPTCPVQQAPVIADGCYTGECVVIGSCGTKPPCENLSHESDCRADTTCSVSYTGINCKKPDNTACTAGDTNCTCDSYQYASCHAGSMTRTTVEYNGFTFNVPAELTLQN
jgi:hypothetical protein